MNTFTRKAIVPVVGVILATIALTGCVQSDENRTYEQRKDQAEQTTRSESLELKNLEEKVNREDDPSAVRYVYLLNYGVIFGYYVIEGKVSSSASQQAPEDEIVKIYTGGDGYIVDSQKDDGSYGPGDPGIFFFTSNGVMVETSLDYIISDAPIAIDVPRLEK